MRVPIRKPGKYTHSKSDRHITKEKLREFERELEKLERVVRPELALEVQRLAELGDFSENAEYQIAKGKLRGINARIIELEKAITSVVIIVSPSSCDYVQLGSRVTMKIAGEQKKYQLLGSAESDPSNGIISQTSPMGVGMIGKKIGDTFAIKLGEKEVECRILKIE